MFRVKLSNGCWLVAHAANLLVSDVDKLKKAAREFYDRKADSQEKIEMITNGLATAIILLVLETTYSKQSLRWGLLAAKAKLFLQGVGAAHDLKVSALRAAADKFIKANLKSGAAQ